tara:strand:+ start:1695 stop:2750 length:1056 start_codon:yes stop_codon:yes gene_type:complete
MYLEHFLRPRLFQLIYHITYACNTNCPFCIHRSYLNARKHDELTLEELDKITSNLPKFPWLMLTGGEPFLRRDLDQIVAIFHKRCKVYHVTLTSNGMYPGRADKFVDKLFKQHPKLTLNLGISIDSVREEHDKIRETTNNYELLTETIELIRKHQKTYPNLSLKAHTVLSKQNAPRFDEIAAEVKRLGVNMHTFDFVRSTGGNEDEELHALEINEIKSLLPKIHKLNKGYSGYTNLALHSTLVRKVSMKVLDRNYALYPEFMEKKTQVVACQAPDRNLVLTPYGEMGFCELREWVGNLRDFDYDIKRLFDTEKAVKLRKSILNKECYCSHPCYQTVNVLFSKKELMKAMIN